MIILVIKANLLVFGTLMIYCLFVKKNMIIFKKMRKGKN